MKLTIRLDATPVLRRLDRIVANITQGRSKELEAAGRSAGAQYLGFIRKRFRGASAGDGTWKRLAASTVRQKGGPVPILRETGRLYASLLPGNPDCVFQPRGWGIRVGSRVPYAEFHQTGAGHLPRRSIFIGPDEPTKQRMQNSYARAFKAAVEAGLKR